MASSTATCSVSNYGVLDLVQHTWVVIIATICLVIVIIKTSFGVVRDRRLPPGPCNWPIFGAMVSIDPHVFMKLAKKYGPIFYYRMGSHNVVVISSPEGAEEVLKSKDGQFADRPNTTLLRTSAKYLGFGCQDMSLNSYNDHLKLLRKACVSHFLSLARLAASEDTRRNEGAAMIGDIMSQIQNGNGTRVEVNHFLSLMSTNIICKVLFSRRFSDSLASTTDELRNCREIVQMFFSLFLSFNLGDRFPSLEWLLPRRKRLQYEDYQQRCTKCYGQVLEEHRKVRRVEGHQDKDFVDVLLTLHEAGKISENAIMGCIMNTLSGGIDTSSNATEWTLLELIKHPETLAKLQKEIDTVVGKDRQVEESDFGNMPYLQAVLRESFRLHNTVPLLVPRFNRSPATVGGFYIPAKTTVFVNAFAIGRDPKLWESPDTFDPERFMGASSPGITLTGGNYRILPFGSGRRMCVGHSFGLLVFQRMLTTLVHAFDWSPPPGTSVDDISTKEKVDLVTHPEEPLILTAKPRLAAAVYSTQF